MVKILLYSTDEIDFDILETFSCDEFTNVAYGKVNNKYWFVFGEYDINFGTTGKHVYKNEEIFGYISKKINMSTKLLSLCDKFGEHVNSKNTDLDINQLKKSTLLDMIARNVDNLKSGEWAANDETTIFKCHDS